MKKAALIVVVALALLAWVALRFRNKDAVATSAAQPWPGGMGTLYTAGDRWPPQKANGASVTLTALTNALPKNEAVDEFVAREIEQGELNISEPPPLPEVSAVRELLLREPITWERHDEIGAQE